MLQGSNVGYLVDRVQGDSRPFLGHSLHRNIALALPVPGLSNDIEHAAGGSGHDLIVGELIALIAAPVAAR
jgi:hypothetical protein